MRYQYCSWVAVKGRVVKTYLTPIYTSANSISEAQSNFHKLFMKVFRSSQISFNLNAVTPVVTEDKVESIENLEDALNTLDDLNNTTSSTTDVTFKKSKKKKTTEE